MLLLFRKRHSGASGQSQQFTEAVHDPGSWTAFHVLPRWKARVMRSGMGDGSVTVLVRRITRVGSGLSGEVCKVNHFQILSIRRNTSVVRPVAVSGSPLTSGTVSKAVYDGAITAEHGNRQIAHIQFHVFHIAVIALAILLIWSQPFVTEPCC